ncbi:6-bladed beta-propeller [Gemmatimonadota bacterium]
MTRKPSSGLSMLVLAGLCLGHTAILQQDGDWEGKERIQNGVRVISTIRGSVWSGPKYLEEELSIGANEEGPYLFIDIVDIDYFDNRYYVADFWAPSVKVYDSAGNFLFSVGGVGAGPGEYQRPDAIEIDRSNHLLLVRDLSLTRINFYDLSGKYLDSCRVISMYQGPSPMVLTHSNQLYSMGVYQTDYVMHRIERRGTVSDTLIIPRPELDYQFIRISRGSMKVPYTQEWVRNMGPSGRIYSGDSNDYRIELSSNNEPVLVIERANSQIRMSRTESEWHKQRITQRIQENDPGWTWNGADIPRTKPAFGAFTEDRDGRIWVYRLGDGIRSNDGDWKDSILFDVFDSDGRFLGPVYAPHGITAKPSPHIEGDMLVAQFMDEDQVPYVRRYRVVSR